MTASDWQRRLAGELMSVVWVGLSSLILLGPQSVLADGVASEEAGWSRSFTQLDVDRDRRLTRDEFMVRAGVPKVLDRDFVLFDFDGDRRLNKFEFAAAYGIDSTDSRAPIPDPMDRLVDQAMEAIDESHENWNLRPDESVDTRLFVTNFIKSISGDDGGSVSGRLLQQADPNEDRRVSRDEAFRFLEQQLGVRWGSERLRIADGRVVDFERFIATDDDRDGEISVNEFMAFWWDSRSLKEDFEANDRDGNGSISLAEFTHRYGTNLVDPVTWFRGADQNLNALLDPEEMESATVGRRRCLIGSSFSGFDEDQDGQLSLQEYRLSMHGSPNYSWTTLPQDSDRDGQISLAEFQFNRLESFQLQRRFYFHRLDSDQDGFLSENEFPFLSQGRSALTMTAVDGKRSRTLLSIVDGTFDSPDVSPDGKCLLFHRTRGEPAADSRIVRLDLDSGRLTELCDGAQPSWSDDGQKFVCARDGDRQGIWIMDADGKDGRRIASGVAPQWSPDGRSIAFLNNNTLYVHDVQAGTDREVIRASDHRYRYFWWNTCWSPDSKKMVLRGDMLTRSDAIIVNMQGPPDPRVRLSETVEIGTEFVWSPDASRVLFPMRDSRQRRTRLFQFEVADDDPPTPVVELDRPGTPKTGCFTPDGQWYISVFRD